MQVRDAYRASVEPRSQGLQGVLTFDELHCVQLVCIDTHHCGHTMSLLLGDTKNSRVVVLKYSRARWRSPLTAMGEYCRYGAEALWSLLC